MEIKQGQYVEITFVDREVQFARVHADLWCDSAVSDNKTIQYFAFDPLTSRGFPCGLCTAKLPEIHAIKPIDELPVKTPFLIDSVSVFFRECPQYKTTGDDRLHPQSFIDRITQFLNTAGLNQGTANASSLDSVGLSELGVDFMRQHYRHIKAGYIFTSALPTESILSYLLTLTKQFRTRPSDWSKCQIPS